MQDILITLVSVAFVLGVMILVHEFGHYAAAKLFGVRVEVFSIGFGKRLVGFRRGDTDYRISLIPLGGYVKMSGENIMEQRSGADYEFMSHPRWQRFVIAFAGPLMNILLAIALLTGVYMAHYEHASYMNKAAVIGWVQPDTPAAKAGLQPGDKITRADRSDNPTWEDVLTAFLLSPNHAVPLTVERGGQKLNASITPKVENPDQGDPFAGLVPDQPNTITEIEPNMPAANAGMKVGDNIVALNGKPTRSLPEMIHFLQDNKTNPVTVSVAREGKGFNFTVVPQLDTLGGQERYRIGIKSDPVEVTKLPFSKALSRSIDENRRNSMLVFDLVGKMIQRKVSVKQMSGPIGIAKASGEYAKQPGWTPLFGFMSVISLQLGIFNLFPIPILDGGMILLLAIEAVRRRDISLAVKERIYQVAYVLLILFAVMVIYNDIAKTIPGGRMQ